MDSLGLISVIIPAYNAQLYLAETLDSVVNQTYKNLEIIVINDGSTDDTQKIIDDYQNRYPELIRGYYQDNKGQSATRNFAIKNYANGEYLGFVDADDLLIPTYFEDLYKACVSDGADVSMIGYEKFMTETGEVFYTHKPLSWKVTLDSGRVYIFQYSPWAKLFKTSFLKDCDIYFSVGEVLEDGPFSIETNLLANKISVVDKIGYRYRFYSNSTMGGVRKKNSTPKLPYNGIRKVVENVKRINSDTDVDLALEYCIVKALAGYCTNMGKNIDKTTRKQLCKYCYSTIKEFFPDVNKNPYIKVGRLKETPLSHRMAVKMFVVAYKLKILYPFSVIVSKVL